MPRKKERKPKGKEHLCWGWRSKLKAVGLAAEKRGDTKAAEKCRCHRRGGQENGRCKFHGGTSRRGPTHQSYKHGKYSTVYRGLFASAIRGREFLEEQFSLRNELDVSYSMIVNEMEKVADSVPAAEIWGRGRQLVLDARRLRKEGDSRGMAAKLWELEELHLNEHPVSTDKVSDRIERHRRLVDTEEKRKDRAQFMISVTMFLGFIEAMAIAVNTHVTNDEERAAIGEEFDTLIRRANYPELQNAALGKVH